MSIMNDILICYGCNIWSFTETLVVAEDHHIFLWLVAEFVVDKGHNIWSFTVMLFVAKATTFVWCQNIWVGYRWWIINSTPILLLSLSEEKNKLLIHVLSPYYTVYLLYNITQYPFLYIILLTQSVYVFKLEPFQTSCCCCYRCYSRRLLHCTSQVTWLLGIANQTGAL